VPPQIPIRPLLRPVSGVVRPPGSKSLTNRALVTAALAKGVSRLHDPLVADDTAAMLDGLRGFGISVDDNDDPWLVLGSGGDLTAPAEPVDAGMSGTTARFLIAVAALVRVGSVTITGRGRMLIRPQEELIAALTAAGVGVTADRGHLPITVSGSGGLKGGSMSIDPSRSSQFVTALLLVAPLAEGTVELVLTRPAVSRPYLTSTMEVMAAFGAEVEDRGERFIVRPTGYRATHYFIEADASAAAYPLVAAAITAGSVGVEGIPASSTQPDLALVDVLQSMGCSVRRMTHRLDLVGPPTLRPIDVDMNNAPDAVLALAVACVFAEGKSRIRNVGNLRLKESDRLFGLKTEIRRLGGFAEVEGDDLVIGPGDLRGAVVQTYDDHRMAMSLALIGLKVPGVVIEQPDVVSKTWPGYFKMLARL
ncbi:MAG TPA: 3-phosphoshikimate 1-carboxyvinyltransferase, partial [Acidimicrobiia bacterium]|nr:3-phosphoshikimate 1-carboxyvinyltransferase [Acidimicrobiia bacterium]